MINYFSRPDTQKLLNFRSTTLPQLRQRLQEQKLPLLPFEVRLRQTKQPDVPHVQLLNKTHLHPQTPHEDATQTARQINLRFIPPPSLNLLNSGARFMQFGF